MRWHIRRTYPAAVGSIHHSPSGCRPHLSAQRSDKYKDRQPEYFQKPPPFLPTLTRRCVCVVIIQTTWTLKAWTEWSLSGMLHCRYSFHTFCRCSESRNSWGWSGASLCPACATAVGAGSSEVGVDEVETGVLVLVTLPALPPRGGAGSVLCWPVECCGSSLLQCCRRWCCLCHQTVLAQGAHWWLTTHGDEGRPPRHSWPLL